MTKFNVSLHIYVDADNVDEARDLAYDTLFYGRDDAEGKGNAVILDYNVEVDEE